MHSRQARKLAIVIALTCAALLTGCEHKSVKSASASSSSSTISTTSTTLDVKGSLNAAQSDLSTVNQQLSDANESTGVAQTDATTPEGDGQ